MQNLFVPFELSTELMKIGFAEKCLAEYRGEDLHADYISGFESDWRLCEVNPYRVLAPTWDQVFNWFRTVHNIDFSITSGERPNTYCVLVNHDHIYGNNGNSPSLFSFQEAKIVCLENLISRVDKVITKLITLKDYDSMLPTIILDVATKYPDINLSKIGMCPIAFAKIKIQIASLKDSIENYNLSLMIQKVGAQSHRQCQAIEDGYYAPSPEELVWFLAVRGEIEGVVI